MGKRLCEYSLIAAKKSKFIKKIYVSTDCPTIKSVSKKYKAVIINRPKKLCTKSALGEDVFRHGYMEIKKDLKEQKKNRNGSFIICKCCHYFFKSYRQRYKNFKKNKSSTQLFQPQFIICGVH